MIADVTVMIVSRLMLIRLRCRLLTTLCIAIITAHVINVTITYRLMFGPNVSNLLMLIRETYELYVVLFYGPYLFSNVNGTVVRTATGNSGIRPYSC